MKSATIIGCVLLSLLTGCAAAPQRSDAGALPARTLPEPFVDGTLRKAIEDRGGEFAAESLISRKQIVLQLERTKCRVALVPPKKSASDLPATYKAGVPSTFVISNLFQCEKCSHWHTRSAATAFAISVDGVCVTNYHVFEHVEAGTRLVIADAWGHAYPVTEILAASKRDDVAIFRVSTNGDRLTPLPMREGIEVGSQVGVISHPANHYYSLSSGIVSRRTSRYHGMNGDIKDADDSHAPDDGRPDHETLTPTLEISADYGVGSSGGPVLDLRGNVVGMVSNTAPVYADPKDRRSLQMNFHHCVPAESILALIESK